MPYKKGDLLFVTNTDIASRIIRIATHSHWCHVAMIINDQGDIVEATSSGVATANASKYANLETMIVDTKMDDEDRQHAVDFCLSHVGSRYDWTDILSIGATHVLRSKISFTSPGKFICSGLCGEGLERGEVNLPRDGAACSPGDLTSFFKAPIL